MTRVDSTAVRREFQWKLKSNELIRFSMKRQPKRSVQISRSRDRVLKYGNKNPLSDGFPIEEGEPVYDGLHPRYCGLPLKHVPDDVLREDVNYFENNEAELNSWPECTSRQEQQKKLRAEKLLEFLKPQYQLVIMELQRRNMKE